MQALTVGHIGNIQIKLHPTLALIVLWVLIDWGGYGVAGAGSLLFSLLFVALVFGCVLLHELGHAFMAMSYGVRVRDVTLSVIGGVARLDHFPTKPRTETMIALAGPAVNIAIMVGLAPFIVLYAVIQGLVWPRDFAELLLEPSPAGLLASLFMANAMLAGFNLLPVFPMDGGRVFRAGLSRLVGRDAGTRVAVLVGQVLAVAMAAASLIWLQNVTVLLLAVFIIIVGHGEGRAVRVETAMRRMRVGQFALWDMGGIAPGQPLTYALRGGPRDVVVTDGGRVVGMLWRNNVLSALRGGGAAQSVADVMDVDVVTADVDDSVFDVQKQMSELKRWAVPVVEDGEYRGIFTADRFGHLYRQVMPSRLSPKHVAGMTTLANSLLRLWVR
ncbi:MAG: site-2 protease family protein [Chloroflexota bacterium]|nr:site-2 protease family protein [Chloroflexota bacterium]